MYFVSSITSGHKPQRTPNLQTNPTHEIHERELYAFLSKRGDVDFNIKDAKGWSPIQRAIITSNVEIMKLLIHKSKGADLNKSSCSNHTPLTYAISKDILEIVEALIKSGADVDQEDDLGWTPLTVAIYKGHQDILTLLISNGANLNFIDSKKWTPITFYWSN